MISQLTREATASARSQPVASLVTILIVIGMVLAVMLTTGRTVGAERKVLESIDSAGSRTIQIRGGISANLTSSVLQRIGNIDGIEWVGGFSIAVDATNSLNAESHPVPFRYAYSCDYTVMGLPDKEGLPIELAWGSQLALMRLGLVDRVGGIATTSGASFGIGGQLEVPDFLSHMEPLLIVPRSGMIDDEPIGLLVVVAATPELIVPVTRAVLSVLEVDDPTSVTVETSAELAELRVTIGNQLGSFFRGLVLAILGLTGTLVAVLLYGLVMMRRKDFGRRRALGATRSLIVALILLQTGLLALLGTVIGLAIAIVILLVYGDPLPGVSFSAALAVLTLSTALIAATVPAIVASRREPVIELRVA